MADPPRVRHNSGNNRSLLLVRNRTVRLDRGIVVVGVGLKEAELIRLHSGDESQE